MKVTNVLKPLFIIQSEKICDVLTRKRFAVE